MKRRRPFLSPERRSIPRRVRAEIMLRQEGRCADCRTRLIIGFFIFDHRPPLALRDEADDPNDPDRLAAICWTCDEQKTPKRHQRRSPERNASPTSIRTSSSASEKRCRVGGCRHAESGHASHDSFIVNRSVRVLCPGS